MSQNRGVPYLIACHAENMTAIRERESVREREREGGGEECSNN